ncbi:lysozyme inhibitor LprI family protein [Pseudomonas yamanorum]
MSTSDLPYDFYLRTYMIYQLTNNAIKFSLISASLVLASISPSAFADSNKDCDLDKTPLTRCEKYNDFINEDKNLNLSYKELRKKLNYETQPKLKAAQLAWIKWRDNKCDQVQEEAMCSNGLCDGVAHDSCIVDLTKQRERELLQFQKNISDVQSNSFEFSKKYEYEK